MEKNAKKGNSIEIEKRANILHLLHPPLIIKFVFVIFLTFFIYAGANYNPRHILFWDNNADGINDSFCDCNGDGINDINNKPYKHLFVFEDKDSNGINDIFIDCDGDGINDLFVINRDTLWTNIVIDADSNGINDITRMVYIKNDYRGYRFGCVWEEKGITFNEFIDKNRNGMDDRIENKRDSFIDENGNGIDDRLEKRMRKRRGR